MNKMMQTPAWWTDSDTDALSQPSKTNDQRMAGNERPAADDQLTAEDDQQMAEDDQQTAEVNRQMAEDDQQTAEDDRQRANNKQQTVINGQHVENSGQRTTKIAPRGQTVKQTRDVGTQRTAPTWKQQSRGSKGQKNRQRWLSIWKENGIG